MGIREQLVAAGPNRWQLARRPDMRVDAWVYLSPALLASLADEVALAQLQTAASLPGATHRAVGMPDLHRGFGVPIGGVVASAEVVSAGAVGYDINCGVRLLATAIPRDAAGQDELRAFVRAVERRVPTGVGRTTPYPELRRHLDDVFTRGVQAICERGFGDARELARIEEGGRLEGADPAAVSQRARQRADQLGTLGGGNHFVELSVVEEVCEPAVAETFGLARGCLAVLIHTGSRGFGHQVCSDYAQAMARARSGGGRELAWAGLDSHLGRDYLAAMACAANFAFSNRQVIARGVREALAEVFGPGPEAAPRLVYDVAHNSAKFEEHFGRRLLVHRKGAIRALPPGHPANPRPYRDTGHPVLIPGSMGTGSYVLTGLPGIQETLCSANHGAGRVLSRREARRRIDPQAIRAALGGVVVNARDLRDVVDEAPQVYKDVDQVVETLCAIGLTRKVARLRPLAVVKGSGHED